MRPATSEELLALIDSAGAMAGADGAAAGTGAVEAGASAAPSGEMAARVQSLRQALRCGRKSQFTLARGERASLVRTYRARLDQARESNVPVAGIQPFLDELDAYRGEWAWGFTVRDQTMIYIGFSDEPPSRLLGVVVMARRAADALLAS